MKWLRPIFYIAVLIIFIIFVQIQKQNVIESRSADVVSIPSEIKKHGIPVDLEALKKSDFHSTFRVTAGLEDKKKRLINFFVSRNQVDQIKKGQKVLYKPVDGIVGEVVSISKSPDAEMGLYKGIVKIKGKEEIKAQNGIKFVDIIVASKPNTLSVPSEVIQYNLEKNEPYVWVAKDQKAHKKIIKIGAQEPSRTEVIGGLSPSEKIIVNGYKYIDEDSNLRIRNCENCSDKNRGTK